MRAMPIESPSCSFTPCHKDSLVSQANDNSATLIPHTNADAESGIAALSHLAVDVLGRTLVAAELSKRDEEMVVLRAGHFGTNP